MYPVNRCVAGPALRSIVTLHDVDSTQGSAVNVVDANPHVLRHLLVTRVVTSFLSGGRGERISGIDRLFLSNEELSKKEQQNYVEKKTMPSVMQVH